MTPIITRTAMVLAVIAVALGLAACGGGESTGSGTTEAQGALAGETGANATALQSLYDEARSAGQTAVNVYPVYSTLQPVADVFNARFPEVRARLTPAFGSELFTKLGAEAASGKHVADVLIQDTSSAGAVSRENHVTPFTAVTASGLPNGQRSKDGSWHRVFDTYNGVAFNPEAVGADEIPDSLDEFFTPEWKGRFAYVQPTGYQLTDIVLTTLSANDRITEGQLRNLKEFGVAVPSANDALTQIAQRQGDVVALLWAPSQNVEVQRQSGAPLQNAPIGQETFHQAGAAALARNAPNQAAAQLFITWLFSVEGQSALAEHHASYGTVAGTAPSGYPNLDDFRLTPLAFETAAAEQEAFYTTTLRPIFGPPLS